MSSTKKRKSTTSSRKTVAVLKDELAEAQALLMEKENDLVACQELLVDVQQDREEIESLREELADFAAELDQTRASLREKDSRLEDLGKDLERVNQELEASNNARDAMLEETTSLTENLRAAQENVNELLSQLEDRKQKLIEMTTERDELAKELKGIKEAPSHQTSVAAGEDAHSHDDRIAQSSLHEDVPAEGQITSTQVSPRHTPSEEEIRSDAMPIPRRPESIPQQLETKRKAAPTSQPYPLSLDLYPFFATWPDNRLMQNQSFVAHLMLNLKDNMEIQEDLLRYKVTISARRLGGGPQILLGEKEGQVTWSDALSMDLNNLTLPSGMYRLEAVVNLNVMDEGTPVAAFRESELIHVH